MVYLEKPFDKYFKHVIENTQPFTIKVVHDGKVQWNTDEKTKIWLSCILIGCIFSGMV